MREALGAVDGLVLVYFLLLNGVQLLLIGLAGTDLARATRRASVAGHEDVFANPLTPGVSVVVPAFDEEATIVEAVRGLLDLRYPLHEVIVVDDGSTDGTFGRLAAAFDLVPVERVIPADVPTIGRVQSVHAPRRGGDLVVVRKENAGRRSDPVNVGINAARHELVCAVDGDSVLDDGALLRIARPFIDDPDRVVATGGTIRAANGCVVERGRVLAPRMPRGWAARIQVVEYLRAFLLGRTGWSRLGGLLIISGAFGLFRRDVLVAVGGYDRRTVGEDAELVARIHRRMREAGRDHRVVFVPEPVCWTEVPKDLGALARQRRRWSRGLAEVLWAHRAMMLNPRHGTVGVLALPYFLVFELLTPVVELAGLLAVGAGLAAGVVSPADAGLVALAAVGLGVLVSVAAAVSEEFSFHRYGRWRDLAAYLAAAVLENLGFRQLHALWRLQGLVAFLRRRPAVWGPMTRAGFAVAPSEAPAAAAAGEAR
ncbi:glycosyltransferase family 2 protein [Miltoncostaea marina]|uniref:glycosyltransferase family 2 protein n=1 Tax=Miltoncostaea marina TaxID=2843215 RepID=UPI001C3C5948|nr:glycosyltransferase family 2 protein [Miltoncostaea marina]